VVNKFDIIKARMIASNKSGHGILKPILIADGQPLAFSPPAMAFFICASRGPRVGSNIIRIWAFRDTNFILTITIILNRQDHYYRVAPIRNVEPDLILSFSPW